MAMLLYWWVFTRTIKAVNRDYTLTNDFVKLTLSCNHINIKPDKIWRFCILGATEKSYNLNLIMNQWKIQALFKKIVIFRYGLHHLCCLMGTSKFWKKTITLVLLNHDVCCANQRPFKGSCTVSVGVILNNEADLAFTIHFHLPNTE